MTITLKKALIAGLSIVAAVFFFLIVILPVSRTLIASGVVSVTETGSLMGVLVGDSASLAMVKNQIEPGTLEDLAKYKETIEALTSVYQFFAVMGIVLFALTLLAAIGSLFMKTTKGARILAFPFLGLDVILFAVIMAFAVLLTATTDMTKYVSVSISVPCVIMYVLANLAIIGMLVSSGIVKDKVLYKAK